MLYAKVFVILQMFEDQRIHSICSIDGCINWCIQGFDVILVTNTFYLFILLIAILNSGCHLKVGGAPQWSPFTVTLDLIFHFVILLCVCVCYSLLVLFAFSVFCKLLISLMLTDAAPAVAGDMILNYLVHFWLQHYSFSHHIHIFRVYKLNWTMSETEHWSN